MFPKKVLVVVSLIAASCLPGAAWSLPYSSLYVFGDSLADTGNNAVFFDSLSSPGALRTPTPLAGPSIPFFPYAPSNTYSNGKVWVDYLADSLGLSSLASSLGGTNYAFGGARTGPDTPPSFPPSLTEQVAMAFGTPGAVAPASALYVVEGGGNDARDVLGAALSGGNVVPLIQSYASNIANILMTLWTKGADQFLLWNVPDIGKIPAVASQGAIASGAASGLVSLMNQSLLFALAQLPSDLTDGVHFFDAYTAFNDVVATPGDFGFGDVTSSCATSAACIADPSGVFFWDGIHPTTAGHQMLASLVLAELPEPGTVMLLVIGLFGVLVVRRRTV